MFWKKPIKSDFEEQLTKIYRELARIEGMVVVQKASIDALEANIASIRNRINRSKREEAEEALEKPKDLNKGLFNPFQT